jgi:hypothetical protein
MSGKKFSWGDSLRFGASRVLFRAEQPSRVAHRYAPLPDGKRFVLLTRKPRSE